MAQNKYLAEAFEALNILNEETFDVTADGMAELKDFVNNDSTEEVETIIDPLAQSEEDLQDSYIGKAILDCVICQSKIYKDPSEVVVSEDETLVNVGEVCPYCQSSDGYKVIGQVAEYCAHCDEEETEPQGEDEVNVSMEDKEDLKEDLQKVELETDTQKIEIEAKPKDEVSEEEMIAPVTPEFESEFKPEEEIDITEFDEEEFDDLSERYLKRVYENVASYKTVSGSTKGNLIKLEGIITFKSGKQVKTNFVFEGRTITRTNKLKFLGENKQFARGKQSFTLTGRADGNKLIAESLTYNYRAKDSKTGASKSLYGTIRR